MKDLQRAESLSCVDVSSWITLRWVRGTRYYRVHLEQDLWQRWLLTKVNGRIGSRLGRTRSQEAASIEAALLELAQIAKRRRLRGYELKHCLPQQKETTMETVNETLRLLKRQAELENAMKQPGGIRITEEQQLHLVRQRLSRFPEAVQAVVEAAHALRRPITELTANDVEQWASPQRVA